MSRPGRRPRTPRPIGPPAQGREGILAEIATAEAERKAAQEKADKIGVSGTVADLETKAKAARKAANNCDRDCRPLERTAGNAEKARDDAKARDAEQKDADAASDRKAALQARADKLQARIEALGTRNDAANDKAQVGPGEAPGKVRLIAISAGITDARPPPMWRWASRCFWCSACCFSWR